MFLRELNQSVTNLRGAGKSVAERLARLGVFSVADLLLRYPRDYDDRSVFVPFSAFAKGGRVHTVARVTGHDWFGFGRMRTLKIEVRDASSAAVLLCFNRPFLEKSLPVGARVLVTGKFQFRYGEIQSSSFEAERLEDGEDRDGEGQDAGAAGGPEEGGASSLLKGILPVYALTDGLQQGNARKLVRAALAEYGARVEDELPPSLVKGRGLLPKREALRELADVIVVGGATARIENYSGVSFSAAQRTARQQRAQAEVPPIAILTRSGVIERDALVLHRTEVPPLILTSCDAAADTRPERDDDVIPKPRRGAGPPLAERVAVRVVLDLDARSDRVRQDSADRSANPPGKVRNDIRALPLRIERAGKTDAHGKTLARSERGDDAPDLRRDDGGRERRRRRLLDAPQDPPVLDERGRDLVAADIHADGSH